MHMLVKTPMYYNLTWLCALQLLLLLKIYVTKVLAHLAHLVPIELER